MESDSTNNIANSLNPQMSRRTFLKGSIAGFAAMAIPKRNVFADTIEHPEEDLYLEKIPYMKMDIPNESLGATDEKDLSKYYPRAIKEGGIVKTENFDFKVTYKGGVFGYETFLNAPEEGKLPHAADVLPFVYAFVENGEGRVVSVNSMAVTSQAQETKDIMLAGGTAYCVIPIVTVGNSSDIVDQGNRVPSGFEIQSANGNTKGYLSFALLQIAKERNSDGTWGLQMLGVVDNTKKGGGVFLTGNFPDDETCKKFNIGK